MTTPTLDQLITIAAKQIEDGEDTDEIFETLYEHYPDDVDEARFNYRLYKTCLR